MIWLAALVATVTGASVDEGAIRYTIRVPGPQAATLQKAFRLAHASLASGVPTRIAIEPGTYREQVLDLNWTEGRVRETPLVIEGRGRVVWSGADVLPRRSWVREGSLLKHPWPHRFGAFGYSWGAKRYIGHRREMAFFRGFGLMPRILEAHAVGGVIQDPARSGEVTYTYQGFRRPAETLKTGEFGVTERAENGAWIYVRLPEGAPSADIEVSVRDRLLDMRGKSNLVIRNVTFFGAANSERGYSSQNALTLGTEADGQRNLLLDRCQFLWNANTGLQLAVSDATVRDCVFRYNGAAGISGGKSRNVLFERNDTSFNVWRAWRGGEIGYYTGGFKMHEVNGHAIRGHTALGNLTMGLWWDVHCKNVVADDVVAIENSANVHFELSQGPLSIRRLLSVGGRYFGPLNLWICGDVDVRDSIVTSNYLGSGDTFLVSFHSSDRDDPHANMEPIRTGHRRLESNLFVGGPNTRDYAALDDVRDPKVAGWNSMRYEGQNNLFWSPRYPRFWNHWADDWKQLPAQPNKVKLASWQVAPTYQEINPGQIDPRFRDPANYDFRSENPELTRANPRLPLRSLSKAQVADMRKFFAWCGFTPGVWAELPSE